MEKMRWFIIGNLIGFGLLIVGIGLNETMKHRVFNGLSDQSIQKPADATNTATASATTTGGGEQQSPGGDTTTDSNAAVANIQTEDTSFKSSTEQNSKKSSVLKTGKLLVATRDITKGTVLHPGDVELRLVELKYAAKDGITSFNVALGAKTKTDLLEGEMLEPRDLEAK